ncbi:MAG: peptidylprolyl isomerase [Clostridia bacterium]|nr:peptidylprolyl isomerase [Clostridia bacterium]
MMKRLLCILLSLAMLISVSFALAEDTADAAAETAEVLSDEPVMLVTVNGEEIWSNNNYLLYTQANYEDWAASNGYNTEDEYLRQAINQQSLYETIAYHLILQKGKELGLDQITEEDKAGFETAAKAQWEEIVNSFINSTGTITAESSDDDKAAARADAEAQLLSGYGFDETRYVDEYVTQASNNTLYARVTDHLSADLKVTDEDIQAYFDDLVKDDQEAYANDAGSYEFYTQYYGQPSYYMPEGYRGITHILLKVDDSLLNNWKDLSARLEEQAQAESTGSEEAPAEEAEPSAEPEPTEEPVTEEMVAEAKAAILESVKATVDEIKAKLDAGASFDDLIKEYGTDHGMQDDTMRAEGYPVHNDSIRYDPAFKDAAMALEKVGDVSDPVVGSYGVHILNYLRDIPGGAVELTEELKDQFRETILQEMISEALHTAVDQWMEESEIVYSEAGESWKLPVNEDDEEDAAEEASAEENAETAEAPAAVLPAE